MFIAQKSELKSAYDKPKHVFIEIWIVNII